MREVLEKKKKQNMHICVGGWHSVITPVNEVLRLYAWKPAIDDSGDFCAGQVRHLFLFWTPDIHIDRFRAYRCAPLQDDATLTDGSCPSVDRGGDGGHHHTASSHHSLCQQKEQGMELCQYKENMCKVSRCVKIMTAWQVVKI